MRNGELAWERFSTPINNAVCQVADVASSICVASQQAHINITNHIQQPVLTETKGYLVGSSGFYFTQPL